MLDRDPQNRISAETALKHTFFSNEMDIEMPFKEMKVNMHEAKTPMSYKKEVETPATQAGKVLEKNAYFDFGKRDKDVRPYFYK